MAGRGAARPGWAWLARQGRRGSAERGSARLGKARQARLGKAWQGWRGKARLGKAGTARLGSAGLGLAWLGRLFNREEPMQDPTLQQLRRELAFWQAEA